MSSIADPALMACWAEAWAISRGAMMPVARDSALYTHVGEPGHIGRYLFAGLQRDDIASLAARIEQPGLEIKVCASANQVSPLLTPDWFIAAPHYMMIARLGVMLDRHAPLPEASIVTVERRNDVTFATISDARGEIAWGRVIIRNGLAMFDRIATSNAHRRRGLGSATMRALAAEAEGRGIRDAILCATSSGRPLYTALGWAWHCDYTTAAQTGVND